MIASMANFMEYDVYDLELKSVKDNTEILIALLISPGNGGRRKERKRRKTLLRRVKKKRLQNVVDGIRSACGGERLIIFTTNHKEKVDEALIRRGRMDKHIEMPYCGNRDGPADVAEILTQKYEGEKREECLKRLVEALEKTKKEAEKKKG
uniref:Uncharacterized protein n=1 Tax=Cucumis sativus TaxID=3659 RepID=A0A0A0LHT6_CUCSA